MKLHEYQAKDFLMEKDLPVPKGKVLYSVDELDLVLDELELKTGVIKAQVFTGGRGKAGGVKLFRSREEAHDIANNMMGMTLVTHQTGPDGLIVKKLYIEEASDIQDEYYLSMLLDRQNLCPVIMVSPEGGMDIEEVADKTPEKILKLYPTFGQGLSSEICKKASDFLGLKEDLADQLAFILRKLYKVSLEKDAMLLEINPLALTGEGKLSILDCKFDIDDNAVYRQKCCDYDPNEDKTDAEIEAARYKMSYISLDGNIGCMVNGAGLAMATMDTIAYYGGQPANFLDVGGSASEEAVAKAFEIITSDPKVETILVNIFGGIMKCDTIARGIIAAVEKTGLEVPLIVRLEGTNVDEGRALINNSGLNIITAESLADGAQKAVANLK